MHDIGSPTGGLFVEEETGLLGQVGEGVGDHGGLELDPELEQLLLQADDDRAFLKEGLQHEANLAVGLPVIEAQRLAVQSKPGKKISGTKTRATISRQVVIEAA